MGGSMTPEQEAAVTEKNTIHAAADSRRKFNHSTIEYTEEEEKRMHELEKIIQGADKYEEKPTTTNQELVDALEDTSDQALSSVEGYGNRRRNAATSFQRLARGQLGRHRMSDDVKAQMALESISGRKDKYEGQAVSRRGKALKHAKIGAAGAIAIAGAAVTSQITDMPGGAAIPIILGVVGGLTAILSIIGACRQLAKRRGDEETVKKCDEVLAMTGSPKEQAIAARKLLKELSKGGKYDVQAATQEAAENDPDVADAITDLAEEVAEEGETPTDNNDEEKDSTEEKQEKTDYSQYYTGVHRAHLQE